MSKTQDKKNNLFESTTTENYIQIHGAEQNNLKNLSLNLPIGKLIAVTGVSGSGKSSLVFDTVTAEGQRRYIETFSSYARQFIDRMDRVEGHCSIRFRFWVNQCVLREVLV